MKVMQNREGGDWRIAYPIDKPYVVTQGIELGGGDTLDEALLAAAEFLGRDEFDEMVACGLDTSMWDEFFEGYFADMFLILWQEDVLQVTFNGTPVPYLPLDDRSTILLGLEDDSAEVLDQHR